MGVYESQILEWMQQNQQWLRQQVAAAPVMGAIVYMVVFALVLGFYIPGGVVLMLLVGAVFPLWQANVVANLGNLGGAVIGFLLSRHLLRDEVQAYYGSQLEGVNEGIRRHGWVYLIILRIAPVLPAPVVNLGMGMTPMSLPVYAVATLAGRIPMTALYVNLGSEIGEIGRMSDLLSIEIIATLFLVAALMLAGHVLLLRSGRAAKAQ